MCLNALCTLEGENKAFVVHSDKRPRTRLHGQDQELRAALGLKNALEFRRSQVFH